MASHYDFLKEILLHIINRLGVYVPDRPCHPHETTRSQKITGVNKVEQIYKQNDIPENYRIASFSHIHIQF